MSSSQVDISGCMRLSEFACGRWLALGAEISKQGEFDLDVARAATGVKYIAMNSMNRPAHQTDKSKPVVINQSYQS